MRTDDWLTQIALAASSIPVNQADLTGKGFSTRNHKYEFISLLDSGDFADIFLLENEVHKKFVLKLVRDPENNDLMANEVAAIRSLPSKKDYFPDLVEDFITTTNQCGSIFKYIDGCNLVTLMKSFPNGLPLEHFAWMFHRLLMIAGEIHFGDLIHGNLDPANIMWIKGSHKLVAMDFVFSVKNREKPVGTNSFSAPEISNGKIYYNSDLYSVGRIGRFLLGTGDIHPDLAKFLDGFLVHDRTERVKDAWKLAHLWNDKLRIQIVGHKNFVPFNPEIITEKE